MRIAALKTGLFPETDTVETALAVLGGDHQLAAVDLSKVEGDGAWEEVADLILSADRVVTI
ncbi:hypothetical protein GGD81_001799 [Rhodobium orientis]|uniref:Uncharacterized protein n=1 Tax=Rhodobium orientis TaxID=34017 RepID=A0A327JTG1_9HYPH|nr:hypothetical protein [Rhodobium orientis]MBB4302763.1 hypothetical protein [Rhodobium orientis]MBK5948543.1 hypothetical protein [Rhodobium orientis]RAI29810.1 hypothetical protein CH339_01985 [Rhodobium orientis]